jgi:O-antigen ligase
MLIGAIPAIVSAGALSGVRTLQGTLGSREAGGLVVLCVLAASMLASAAAMARQLRLQKSASPPDGPHPTIRRLAVAGGLAVAVATAVVFIEAATSTVANTQTTTATSARLATTDSIRGNFWRVAVSGFAEQPIRGLGAGGFETEWRRRRTILYYARDAHSVYLETLSELGIVGALALVAMLAGVVASARRAYRIDAGLSAGWIAVVSMWAVHAGLEWDWEMPAVSLFALTLVAAILAQADVASTPTQAAVAVTSATETAPLAAGVES